MHTQITEIILREKNMGKPNDAGIAEINTRFTMDDGATLQLHGASGCLFEAGYLSWRGVPPELREEDEPPQQDPDRLSSIKWKSWHISSRPASRNPKRNLSKDPADMNDLLSLVKAIALKIHRPLPASVMLNDLIQDGMIGLMTAMSEHDDSLGIPFRVYAENKIRWAIMDGLRAGDWAGRSLRRRATKVAKTTAKLQALLNREPSKQEIADELQIHVDDVTGILGEAHGYSFVRINDAENGEMQDIPDSRMEPQPLVEFREGYSRALAGLQTLRPNERQAIVLRTLCDMSVQQAAAEMKVSESRISQLCKKASEKLARYMA